jgi:hypothetical protein
MPRLGRQFAWFYLVHITPYPRFTGLVGTDEWMLRLMEVFGRVLILGRVAATHVATNQAQAQVNPSVPHLHALLTDMYVGFGDLDLFQVSAFFCHRFLRKLLNFVVK